MKKDYSKVFDKYIKKNDSVIAHDERARELLDAVKNGSVKYARVTRTEDTARDVSWVGDLMEGIKHIQNIVDNPKSGLKSMYYIVPAELAKKTGPESIVHLATHSQFVKNIEDDGTIVPSKIQVSEAEIDYATYENRFVMTLIKRVYMYVEKRYVYLKRYASLKNSDILYLDNDFKFGDTNITTTTTITMSQPTETNEEMLREIAKSLEDLEFIRKYSTYFMNCQFMKEFMKGAPKVSSPIMQTNVIRKNPHYHACFQLWQFLNKEEHASMEFLVDEDVKQLTKEERERIDYINYLSCLDVIIGKDLSSMRFTKKKYTTQVLKSIDERLFLNDKFQPFELVRADEQYFKSLAEPLERKLAGKSPRVQNKVFKKTKQELAQIEKEKRALLALKRRKEREAAKLDRIAEQRRIQEQNRLEKEAIAAAKQAEKDRITELENLRKEIRSQAIQDKNKKPEELITPVTPKKIKLKGEIKEEIKPEFEKVKVSKSDSFKKVKFDGKEKL